ncbi:hypothetical protein EJ03DRAFT_255685, partial [Teratosphaeria nubilosa]
DLNNALRVLAEVFPDVEPEMFREMLLNVSEQSRVEIVTESLLKKGPKAFRGRNRLSKQPAVKRAKTHVTTALRIEDTFRSAEYQKAVKQVCYQEFRSLSHSSIKAVLAEQNYSYILVRPVLQQLKARAWRFSFPSFWPSRTPSQGAEQHPFIVQDADAGLAVKRTGSPQLDHELYQLLVEPVLTKQRQKLLTQDHKYASQINGEQAAEADSLFDCECCFDAVPFEQLAVCNDGTHQLCFDCIRRTVNEAIYGQGWTRTADLTKTTVRCFAPADCRGCIPSTQVHRALVDGTGNEEIWTTFQQRLTRDVLMKSNLNLQRCPFCEYAEIDEHQPTLKWPISIITTLLFWLILSIAHLGPIQPTLHASWTRVKHHRHGLKFHCLNPLCLKTTCTRCLTPWLDPHTCFSREKTSLRTALETSATAAIKRTCPKCHLSFVKSSGCNKLVCNCGYTMCYVCRQEITVKEGYGHFCQHFRPNGGRCWECERCDLYGDEDEEVAIRRAVEGAEREWRERE